MTEPGTNLNPPTESTPAPTFVSRGGLKLHQALIELPFDPTAMVCADFGCSTGGFTDCLLQHGAKRVHSIDTAYGELAWKLRQDERVVVHERRNALHLDPPGDVIDSGGIDLAVIDLGWTRQERALPAAARWLKPGGRIISLVKPHYEAQKEDLGEGGVLDPDRAREIAERVRDGLPAMGYEVHGWVKSPVLGGAVGKKRKKKGKGNPEWLVLVSSRYSIDMPPPAFA